MNDQALPHAWADVRLFMVFRFGETAVRKRAGSLAPPRNYEKTYYYAAGLMLVALIAPIAELGIREHVPPVWLTVLGGGVFVAGIALRFVALLQLGEGFSLCVERPEKTGIIQHGLYARIRHPLYAASVLILVGGPIMLACVWAWIATAAAFVALGVRISYEEKFLCAEYPEYREYMARTARFVPGVF